METAVEVERLIEAHNDEKTILKFLNCANHFHRIICKENCGLDKFLDTATDRYSILSLNCPCEKKFLFKSSAVPTTLSLLIFFFFKEVQQRKLKMSPEINEKTKKT